jgi:transposase
MASKTANRFSPEVRARAVRLVFEYEKDHASRWASVTSIAAKIGCTAQSLNEWVKKAQVDSGARAGVPTEIAERLKALERENRELRQANEILRKASAYFAHARLGACGSQLSNRLRAATGARRNSSKSHRTRDGHRFESPQLHHFSENCSSNARAAASSDQLQFCGNALHASAAAPPPRIFVRPRA